MHPHRAIISATILIYALSLRCICRVVCTPSTWTPGAVTLPVTSCSSCPRRSCAAILWASFAASRHLLVCRRRHTTTLRPMFCQRKHASLARLVLRADHDGSQAMPHGKPARVRRVPRLVLGIETV
eukprot:scaffold106223_cov26-Tisochrysis_lutea.AAC.3